jgi:hypothetical protein
MSATLSRIEDNAVNMLALLDRHFTDIGAFEDLSLRKMAQKRRSEVMCGAGRLYMHKKDFSNSRRWYLSALKERPLSCKALCGVFAALLRLHSPFK